MDPVPVGIVDCDSELKPMPEAMKGSPHSNYEIGSRYENTKVLIITAVPKPEAVNLAAVVLLETVGKLMTSSCIRITQKLSEWAKEMFSMLHVLFSDIHNTPAFLGIRSKAPYSAQGPGIH